MDQAISTEDGNIAWNKSIWTKTAFSQHLKYIKTITSILEEVRVFLGLTLQLPKTIVLEYT
jgi:hypothetical protein